MSLVLSGVMSFFLVCSAVLLSRYVSLSFATFLILLSLTSAQTIPRHSSDVSGQNGHGDSGAFGRSMDA